jgi:hypothetical protein
MSPEHATGEEIGQRRVTLFATGARPTRLERRHAVIDKDNAGDLVERVLSDPHAR